MPNLLQFFILVASAAVLSVTRDEDRRLHWNTAQFLLTIPLCVFGFWLGGVA